MFEIVKVKRITLKNFLSGFIISLYFLKVVWNTFIKYYFDMLIQFWDIHIFFRYYEMAKKRKTKENLKFLYRTYFVQFGVKNLKMNSYGQFFVTNIILTFLSPLKENILMWSPFSSAILYPLSLINFIIFIKRAI